MEDPSVTSTPTFKPKCCSPNTGYELSEIKLSPVSCSQQKTNLTFGGGWFGQRFSNTIFKYKIKDGFVSPEENPQSRIGSCLYFKINQKLVGINIASV